MYGIFVWVILVIVKFCWVGCWTFCNCEIYAFAELPTQSTQKRQKPDASKGWRWNRHYVSICQIMVKCLFFESIFFSTRLHIGFIKSKSLVFVQFNSLLVLTISPFQVIIIQLLWALEIIFLMHTPKQTYLHTHTPDPPSIHWFTKKMRNKRRRR